MAVKPTSDPKNPNLWSPGIKLGVKPNSFMHQTELFGPVLGVMRAENLTQAIELANGTVYGLTSGLHSLDDREHRKWLAKIEAGNLYVIERSPARSFEDNPLEDAKQVALDMAEKLADPILVSIWHT